MKKRKIYKNSKRRRYKNRKRRENEKRRYNKKKIYKNKKRRKNETETLVKSNILELPLELLHEIVDIMDVETYQNLKRTSKYFNRNEFISKKEQIEKWERELEINKRLIEDGFFIFKKRFNSLLDANVFITNKINQIGNINPKNQECPFCILRDQDTHKYPKSKPESKPKPKPLDTSNTNTNTSSKTSWHNAYELKEHMFICRQRLIDKFTKDCECFIILILAFLCGFGIYCFALFVIITNVWNIAISMLILAVGDKLVTYLT